MYQPGELIFYGNTGVCRVESVTARKRADEKEKKSITSYRRCIIPA